MTQLAEDTYVDLTRFIDRVAQLRYEMFDSHFSMPDGLTWEQYKTEDPGGAEGVYLSEARVTIMKALPSLNLRPVKALAWEQGYLRGTIDTTSDLEPADNPYGD